MIGILILAHDPVASSFGKAISHVLGNVPAQLEWLDVANNAHPPEVVDQARQRIARLNSGEGVLVCSDVCGATPCNIATQLSQPGQVNVLTGLNLAMLLRAINYRNLSLDELTEKALTGAKAGVMRMESGNAAN